MTDGEKRTIQSLAGGMPPDPKTIDPGIAGASDPRDQMRKALDSLASVPKRPEPSLDIPPRAFQFPKFPPPPPEASIRMETMLEWSEEKLSKVLTSEISHPGVPLSAGAREAITLEILRRRAERSESKQKLGQLVAIVLSAIAAVASVLALPQVQKHVFPEPTAFPAAQTLPTPPPQ